VLHHSVWNFKRLYTSNIRDKNSNCKTLTDILLYIFLHILYKLKTLVVMFFDILKHAIYSSEIGFLILFYAGQWSNIY